jgi:hypothetical protein
MPHLIFGEAGFYVMIIFDSKLELFTESCRLVREFLSLEKAPCLIADFLILVDEVERHR